MRKQLTEQDIKKATELVYDKTIMRAKQKGFGSMASSHEILGILSEEMAEYRDEVHHKSTKERKISELEDIAVAAIFGIASIDNDGTDW